MTRLRTGIALLNMGSPAAADDTRAFLFRLFSDPDIFRFPGGKWFRPLFAGLISSLRASRVRQRYRIMGGASPLLEITRKQAASIEALLRVRGYDFPVEVCMRYSPPLTEEALERLLSRGADAIIGLPLYPQYSTTTTGSSLRVLRAALGKTAPVLPYEEIRHWYDLPGYHAALAGRILSCWNRIYEEGRTGLLFLAHSIPTRFVREGDPYIGQVQDTVQGILHELKRQGPLQPPWFLGYQGQVGPVKWEGPPVREVLERMMAEGIRRVVVIPVSFVSDHLETLYEIDLEYRRLALEMGVEAFERIESLNDGEDFIETLVDLVLRHLPGKQEQVDG